MGTSEIADRLDERFRLLAGGQRGRVERHKTLRATVEWSYALLDADERAVFDLLSVFAGTFDLDAVLAVCAGDGLDDYQTIDAIGSLVAKSMVVVDEHPTLGTRYRLLETLRAFGHERMEAAGQLDAARTRHAAHYCRRGHDAAVDIWRADTARSGGRLLADVADHRAAHNWMMGADRAEAALVHATNLLDTAVWRGWREPAAWLHDALAEPDAEASAYRPHALGALANYLGEVDYNMEQAERLGRDSIASRVDQILAGEPTTLSAEIATWLVAMSRGDFEGAVREASRQAERGRRRQDLGDVVFGFGEQALAWSFLGRLHEARSAAEELERYLGPHPGPLASWGLHFSRGTVWANEDPDRAVAYFEQGSRAAAIGGFPLLGHICNRDLMAIRIGRLPPPQAAATAREVLADMWDVRDVYNIRIAVAHTVVVCVRAGQFAEAGLIDGWLGPDVVPLAPRYAARLETARRDIDLHVDDAATLRSRGAGWPPAAVVEFALTTLSSIAETPGTDADSEVAS